MNSSEWKVEPGIGVHADSLKDTATENLSDSFSFLGIRELIGNVGSREWSMHPMCTPFVPSNLFNPSCHSTQEGDISPFYICKDEAQRNKRLQSTLTVTLAIRRIRI